MKKTTLGVVFCVWWRWGESNLCTKRKRFGEEFLISPSPTAKNKDRQEGWRRNIPRASSRRDVWESLSPAGSVRVGTTEPPKLGYARFGEPLRLPLAVIHYRPVQLPFIYKTKAPKRVLLFYGGGGGS